MANPLREEIIRRIDLASEFQKYGARCLQEPSCLHGQWSGRAASPELPLVQYKTISVDGSLLTINDQHLKSPNGDPIMPLHIVRGNFAIYNEKPLFGKHFGTFWRSQYSRGSKELGIIAKDYTIGDLGK